MEQYQALYDRLLLAEDQTSAKSAIVEILIMSKSEQAEFLRFVHTKILETKKIMKILGEQIRRNGQEDKLDKRLSKVPV